MSLKRKKHQLVMMFKNGHRYYSYGLILLLIVTGFTVHADASSETITEKRSPEFIDKNKDPQYYIDRYYNEKEYRKWFDRNYPNYTIEEAVGYSYSEKASQDLIKNNIIPEAQALSTEQQPSESGEFAQIVLAISALAILFGATYGIKKKVDDNSRQISINKNTIKQKIIKPIIGSEPFEILQLRLVKGEITLQEFREIKNELNLS